MNSLWQSRRRIADHGKRGSQRPANAVAEALEQRRFLSVSSYYGTAITDITGYDYYADVIYGDNGDPYGAATINLGTNLGATDYDFYQWDSNPYDGIDSGSIPVEFSANASGSDTVVWDVDDANILQASENVLSSIGKVTIRAAVLGPDMLMAWDDLTVRFYQGSSLVETVNLDDEVLADTFNSSTWDPFEYYVDVTPSQSGCDKVIVTGTIRLAAAQDVYPGQADIFGQIFIFDAA